MNKHLKLFSALLVLMLFAPVSMFVCPADAEAAQTLVENSWRYEGGQLVSDDASSEEDGIALLSMDALPDGVTAQGIDVSEHQGRIDWDAVKASGIDFAILRVGFGAPSFGGRVDYQFNRNISECERLGIPYGVYVYSYAFDNQQAADEASMVIDCLSGHNPRLPVYYDLEDKTIIADGRQSGIASRAQTFCNKISSAGYKPGIYANLNWFNNILTDPVFKSGSWDHWIAQYNSQCHYTASYSFWQYTSRGKVSGISGNVDMNYAYVDVSLYYWQLKEGTWYYATSDGKAYTGWLRQGGAWYWLDPSTHAMATGLHECNGSMYWFNSSGAMATGWVLDGGTWYYATGSGALARGPVSVGGVPYCFDARTGAMLTGYQTDAQGVRRYFGSCGPLNGWGLVDGSWYWFADGIASTGWLYTGGSWYWLDPDAGGAMATGLHSCNGSAYWFNSSGAMATGWVLDGGTWYYATGSGALASGWLNLNGAWYWLDPSTHAMATGLHECNGSAYWFNASGAMATGWLNDGSNWYWLDSASGAMKTGWLSLGGTWYYLDAARGGVMLSNGWYWIGSTDYKFSSSGAMVGAWVDVPCYLQYPELPTGCESVALTNLLNYYGFGLGKTIIADYYLPKGSNGNFVTAFDGNPRRSSGGLMGCVAPAITIAGNNFLRAAGSIMQAKDVSFSSISSIKNRLTCGQPVEMWNTEWGSWPGGRYAARWYNGHSYGLWGGNHAVVLKGYDDEQGIVYLSDSINGNVTRNAQVFFGTWQQMDSQAVVIE